MKKYLTETANIIFIAALLIVVMPGCAVITGVSSLPESSRKAVPELRIIDQKVGGGAVAEFGKQLTVHYTGWLYDVSAKDNKGVQFDTSLRKDRPLIFRLGKGAVIAGWEQGLKGMRLGGKRQLVIPADMAYGARGLGTVIPSNADLIFDVELVEVND